MKRIISLLPIFILIISSCYGQSAKNETIHWISFEDALTRSSKEPKKIFMDIYTEWCGWCKKMDKSTFTDPAVIDYLNKHFYSVKLDAETKDTITYKAKDYTFVSAYKSNEIAAYLLNGQMGYPTAVYLDEKSDPITAVPGYFTSEQLIPILKYFGENIYKTKKWEEYQSETAK